MPELGEIKQAREVGRKSRWMKYIWADCEICGKERWVRFLKGKPESLKCSNHSIPILFGENNPMWKGGIIKAKRTDYVHILIYPDDFFYPMANRDYVLEHRLVSDDRHKQITLLERRITFLEKRVIILETDNILLSARAEAVNERELKRAD